MKRVWMKAGWPKSGLPCSANICLMKIWLYSWKRLLARLTIPTPSQWSRLTIWTYLSSLASSLAKPSWTNSCLSATSSKPSISSSSRWLSIRKISKTTIKSFTSLSPGSCQMREQSIFAPILWTLKITSATPRLQTYARVELTNWSPMPIKKSTWSWSPTTGSARLSRARWRLSKMACSLSFHVIWSRFSITGSLNCSFLAYKSSMSMTSKRIPLIRVVLQIIRLYFFSGRPSTSSITVREQNSFSLSLEVVRCQLRALRDSEDRVAFRSSRLRWSAHPTKTDFRNRTLASIRLTCPSTKTRKRWNVCFSMQAKRARLLPLLEEQWAINARRQDTRLPYDKQIVWSRRITTLFRIKTWEKYWKMAKYWRCWKMKIPFALKVELLRDYGKLKIYGWNLLNFWFPIRFI